MSGARGIAAGLLGLTLLDAALTSKFVTGGAGAVGGLFDGAAKVLDYWLDRNQPLISKPCTSSSNGGGSGVLGGAGQIIGGTVTDNPGQVIGGVGRLGKGVWNDTVGQINAVTPAPSSVTLA